LVLIKIDEDGYLSALNTGRYSNRNLTDAILTDTSDVNN